MMNVRGRRLVLATGLVVVLTACEASPQAAVSPAPPSAPSGLATPLASAPSPTSAFGPGHTFAPRPGPSQPTPVTPDRFIAFARWAPSGENHLYTIKADGTSERQIGVGDSAAWRPDGEALLVPRTLPDGRAGAAIVGIDGELIAAVAPPDPGLDLQPGVWSPDGDAHRVWRMGRRRCPPIRDLRRAGHWHGPTGPRHVGRGELSTSRSRTPPTAGGSCSGGRT